MSDVAARGARRLWCVHYMHANMYTTRRQHNCTTHNVYSKWVPAEGESDRATERERERECMRNIQLIIIIPLYANVRVYESSACAVYAVRRFLRCHADTFMLAA